MKAVIFATSIIVSQMKADKMTLDLHTVCECNDCLGTKTLHPQATIVDLGRQRIGHGAVKFEFYAIMLIAQCPDGCTCCGRRYYDFADATMVFLTPGEVFRMSADDTLPDHGRLLAFHPDLLATTSLRNNIGNYTFFNYRKEEALHLSERETRTVKCCMEYIDDELHHAIDTHTCTILSRQIELLLDFCSRFYERQFITRENKNKAIIARFSHLLDDYLMSGRLEAGAIPEASCFAPRLNLSEAYFADLLRFETGKDLAQYVRLRQIELAKQLLLSPASTPVGVARRLGFANVQVFTAIFRKLTGTAPGDYRLAAN